MRSSSASGLTKHLAVEWASHGIRVNAVAPGTINTERVQRLPEEPGGPEYLEVIKAAHPMGKLGEPSGVAEAILFLASIKRHGRDQRPLVRAAPCDPAKFPMTDAARTQPAGWRLHPLLPRGEPGS